MQTLFTGIVIYELGNEIIYLKISLSQNVPQYLAPQNFSICNFCKLSNRISHNIISVFCSTIYNILQYFFDFWYFLQLYPQHICTSLSVYSILSYFSTWSTKTSLAHIAIVSYILCTHTGELQTGVCGRMGKLFEDPSLLTCTTCTSSCVHGPP